jgi:hypothetical protein
VLGLKPFDNPYKFIAADINNNEKVTGSDLVELRKMILGINSEFPNNMSWRTIDANYVFPDPSNPWTSELPEGYKILSLDQDMKIDFVGVKIGDIDGNVTVNLKSETSATRSDETRTLIIEKSENSQIFEVKSKDILTLAGLQFTVNLSGMNITDIKSAYFNSNEIGFYEVKDGIYNISIAGTKPLSVYGDETILEIMTDCISCKLTPMNFKLVNDGLTNEIYINQSIESVPLELEVRNDDYKSQFVVYQNNPNPWTNYTKVDISLQKEENVNIRVFDVNGRLVYSNSSRLNAGLNTIEFDNLLIAGSGVFYYEISTSTNSERYKMIKLN